MQDRFRTARGYRLLKCPHGPREPDPGSFPSPPSRMPPRRRRAHAPRMALAGVGWEGGGDCAEVRYGAPRNGVSQARPAPVGGYPATIQTETGELPMTNRKTNLKTAIACAMIVLAAMVGVFSIPPATARAEDLPAETVNAGQLSDIQEGYDASLSGIGYEIQISAF